MYRVLTPETVKSKKNETVGGLLLVQTILIRSDISDLQKQTPKKTKRTERPKVRHHSRIQTQNYLHPTSHLRSIKTKQGQKSPVIITTSESKLSSPNLTSQNHKHEKKEQKIPPSYPAIFTQPHSQPPK